MDKRTGEIVKKKIFNNKTKVKFSNLDVFKKKIIGIANEFLVAN